MLPSDLGLPSKFTAYHDGQEDAVLSIASSPRRFQLLSAPTGAGKTCINISIAALRSARVLYLVSTKTLQDQVYRDMSAMGMIDIRGHSNYACAATSSDHDDELADFSCSAKRSGGECEYYAVVEQALATDYVVTNYAHWVALARVDDAERLGHFDMIICDEAHLLHDILVSQLAITLTDRQIRQLLDAPLPSAAAMPNVSDWRAWAESSILTARARYADLRSLLPPGQPATREMLRLTRLGKDLSRFISESSRVEWVAEPGSLRSEVVLTPVWGRTYAEQYLYRGIPTVILCSANLDRSDADYLGIPASAFDYHEMQSTFAVARRPIIFVNQTPKIRVDNSMSDGERRLLVKRFDDFIDQRLDRKGVIFPRSYKNADKIYELSRHRSIMLTHGPHNAATVIRQFRDSSAPCILISPAIEEGHDFIGDIARYAIFYKVPFIYAKSPLIAARVKSNRGYINHLASKSIMQSAGRIVRSMDDWGECVIFDDHWSWFRNRAPFAKWFRRAFVETSKIPLPLVA